MAKIRRSVLLNKFVNANRSTIQWNGLVNNGDMFRSFYYNLHPQVVGVRTAGAAANLANTGDEVIEVDNNAVDLANTGNQIVEEGYDAENAHLGINTVKVLTFALKLIRYGLLL